MSRLRLGIVGPGLMWKRSHEPVLRNMQDVVELAAFSAHSQATRDATAVAYPQAEILADYRDLAASPRVDVVVVLTPIALNAPVARAALEAGKDVIMEKPMARSVAEAQELIATMHEAGRRIAVLEQEAYSRRNHAVKELLDSGALGELVMFERVWHSRSEPQEGRFSGTSWRIEADFPLGTLFDGGHHAIAGLSTIFGPPKAVCASAVQLRPEYGEYDHALIMFEYGGLLRGVMSESSYLGSQRNYAHVRGTRGIIEMGREYLKIVRDDGERIIEVPRENPWEMMWRDFVAGLTTDKPMVYDHQSALRELIILDTIDRSIKSGTKLAVKLP